MSTQLVTQSFQSNFDTNDIVKSFCTDKYTSQHLKEKKQMVINYKAIRRVKRNISSHQPFIFQKEDSSIPSLSNLKQANLRLNAHHWYKYFDDTQLFIMMTGTRKNEWKEQIEALNVPEFNTENLRSVTSDILNSSQQYFAERIVYVMSHLSKNHITNSQFGFGEKIIIEDIHDGWSQKNKSPIFKSEKVEALDELRKIIAFLKYKDIKLMDKNESMSSYLALDVMLKRLVKYRTADNWIDDNTIHVKMFLKGTMHICIEPEMAAKMNSYVALLYPNQIPSCIKRKAYFKPATEKALFKGDIIPKEVLKVIRDVTTNHLIPILTRTHHRFDLNNLTNFDSEFELEKEYFTENNTVYLSVSDENTLTKLGYLNIFLNIMKYIGAKHFKYSNTRIDKEFHIFVLKHRNFNDIIDEICFNGALDDQKSYQQYYTKQKLSDYAYHLLSEDYSEEEIKQLRHLEPSCGTGNLISYLPKENTTGVEISKINSAICLALGYKVLNKDFIKYASKTTDKYDSVFMNPPFTENQAYNHIMAAYTLLDENGQLVAILPCSLKGKFNRLVEEDCIIFESENFESQFEDTNVTVFVLKIRKA